MLHSGWTRWMSVLFSNDRMGVIHKKKIACCFLIGKVFGVTVIRLDSLEKFDDCRDFVGCFRGNMDDGFIAGKADFAGDLRRGEEPGGAGF